MRLRVDLHARFALEPPHEANEAANTLYAVAVCDACDGEVARAAISLDDDRGEEEEEDETLSWDEAA